MDKQKGDNVKDITMGNQQVTQTRIAWLAGIWDGEGTFGIYRYRQTTNGKWSYCGRLTLSNTSEEMIQEILEIFEKVGIKASTWRNQKPRQLTHRKEVHITVNRQESVKIGCELMLPYLIAKKNRAKILLEFIKIRSTYKRKVNRDPQTGRLTGVVEQGYNNVIHLYEEMKELNQVGNSKVAPQRLHAKVPN
jgi:intein/homing endonuclease